MLSEPGAPAKGGTIPLSVPFVGEREIEMVTEAIRTNWVSSGGPFVKQFEDMTAEIAGVKHAISTVNGTAALHVALLALGIEPDDEVLVSSLTFLASVNAVRYAGAWPVFIDAEPEYWQMDSAVAAKFLREECARDAGGVLRNKRTNRRVRAMLPVHIMGHPCDMDSITAVAREFGLLLLEDAAESIGSTYKGRPAGSIGNAGCLSFNGNKMITTGGGGMVLTNDDKVGKRARHLTTQAKQDAVEFIHDEVGYNYRLTNLLAGLGIAQLERLDAFLAKKKSIYARYGAAFADVPGIQPMRLSPEVESNLWLYTVQVDPDAYGMNRRELLSRLFTLGIQTRPLWQPAHMSPAYRKLTGVERRECPVAEHLHNTTLSLPCSIGLSESDQDRVIEAVRANAVR